MFLAMNHHNQSIGSANRSFEMNSSSRSSGTKNSTNSAFSSSKLADSSITSIITTEKPRRPLSAYNLFFRLERSRLRNHQDDYENVDDGCDETRCDMAMMLHITEEDVANISTRQRYSDGTKRQHRKNTVGISLGFNELTRRISNKWKRLPNDIKILFEKRADAEKKHYQEQLKVWKHRQASSFVATTDTPVSEKTSSSHHECGKSGNKDELVHSSSLYKSSDLFAFGMEMQRSKELHVSDATPNAKARHMSIGVESMPSIVSASTLEQESESFHNVDNVSLSICDGSSVLVSDDYGNVSSHKKMVSNDNDDAFMRFRNQQNPRPSMFMEKPMLSCSNNCSQLFCGSDNYPHRLFEQNHVNDFVDDGINSSQNNNPRRIHMKSQQMMKDIMSMSDHRQDSHSAHHQGSIDHLQLQLPQHRQRKTIFDVKEVVKQCQSAYQLTEEAFDESLIDPISYAMYNNIEDDENDVRCLNFQMAQGNSSHYSTYPGIDSAQHHRSSNNNSYSRNSMSETALFPRPFLTVSNDDMMSSITNCQSDEMVSSINDYQLETETTIMDRHHSILTMMEKNRAKLDMMRNKKMMLRMMMMNQNKTDCQNSSSNGGNQVSNGQCFAKSHNPSSRSSIIPDSLLGMLRNSSNYRNRNLDQNTSSIHYGDEVATNMFDSNYSHAMSAKENDSRDRRSYQDCYHLDASCDDMFAPEPI